MTKRKFVEVLFSIVTLIFCILGICKIVSYTICVPVACTGLAGDFFMNAYDRFLLGNKKSMLFHIIIGVFSLICAIIYLAYKFL